MPSIQSPLSGKKLRQGSARQNQPASPLMKTKIHASIIKVTLCSTFAAALLAAPVALLNGSQKRQESVSTSASSEVQAQEAQKIRASADAPDVGLFGAPPVAPPMVQKRLPVVPVGGPVIVTATGGNTGPTPYATLGAAFAAINAGTHLGDITVSIQGNTAEPGPAVLNSSGAGLASYTSVLIRPTVDGVTVSGATATGRGLIELNGADNITIDGDNPNTPGINQNLTINDTATPIVTFTSVIRIALATTIVTSADNNSFKNLNIIGSSPGRNISGATSTTGSENTTFGIFVGPGASTVDPTAPPAAIASVSTGVGSPATASNLIISNNNLSGSMARGISMNGSATTVMQGLRISNNTIGNVIAGSVDQVTSIGITVQGSTNAIVSKNTVWVEGYIASSSATHGIDTGVNSTAVSATTIDSNKVNRVQNNNGGTWSAYGINLGGGSNHIVQNNFVSHVINSQVAGTGGFGTTFGAYGIRAASGTGHRVYHNSVHLSGVLQGTISTDLTTAFMITSTTLTGMDVRNNLFSNQVTGGNPAPVNTRHACVYLPSGGTSSMNLTWNNNGYYQGPSAVEPKDELAQVGSTAGTGEYYAANFDPSTVGNPLNLRTYTNGLSGAATNDNMSFAVTSPPPTVNDTDLHIPNGTATRLESGGASVGVLMDIDMEARSPFTPDIGADEFNGTQPCPNDIAATAFVRPTNGSGVPNGSTIMPQASFTNVATSVQTNVMVQFTINGPGGYNYINVQGIPTINPNQQITVIFAATPMFTLTGSYQMDAAVITPDCNAANDVIHGNFNVGNPLGGTITVGAGATYSSLTNPGGVFDAINNFGLNGSLNVDIISDLTTETGTVALNQWVVFPDCSCNVTIRPRGMLNSPNGGVPRTISGTSVGGGLIKLNGPDGVTIDGSIGGGGTDRSLTITNGNANATVIWIASASASDGANNITVKNCNISGNPGVIAVAGILSGSGTTLGNDAEAQNNNITIQNNNIFRVQNSCYLRGTATGTDTGLVVTGNTFGSTVAGDKNIFRGMGVFNSTGFLVTGNTINGVVSAAGDTSKMTGIQTGLVINGGTIEKNKISDIKQIHTGTYGATGIDLTGNNILVKNNFVSDVNHDNSGGIAFSTLFGVFGIQIEAGNGIQVYNNSVNLFGSIGTGNSSLLDAAFAINATTSTGCDVRDNILANNITGGTTSIAHVAVYLPSGGTSAMNLTENNNSYYNGTDAARQGVGQAGTTAGTNFFVTLLQLKAYSMTLSPPGTNDNASMASTGPVPYLSATDLHLMCTALEIHMAVPLAAVTDDIDNDPRPAAPTIGADEPTTCAPTLVSAVSRKTCDITNFDIPLPASCPNGVECRIGPYLVVAHFSQAVSTSPTAAIECGTPGSIGVVTVAGNDVMVPVLNTTDQEDITLRIDGVNGSNGFRIPMGILVGDVNGNGVVNAADVAQDHACSGAGIDQTNFRCDVNANCSLNAGDVSLVKSKLGHGITRCCVLP